MADDKLKTATVLAFERKLDPSDALFCSGRWDQRDDPAAWRPVRIREKSVRGTISNRLKTKDQDHAKLDALIENPNLQTVDVAALPGDADTLRVQFTLRVLPGVGEPSACNDAAYRAKLMQTVRGYVQQQGLGELARRYAGNLANGRFLWRNRVGAEDVEVRVAHRREGQSVSEWRFQALERPLSAMASANDGELAPLGTLIESGLSGEGHVLLQVTAYVRLGEGQEVFPSQELILERARGTKSKTLYAVGPEDDEVAAIHSQKIGNALRTIDTWYAGADNNGPISVEPYGSVTTQGKAFRQPKEKQDFYNLLDSWVLKDKVPPLDQQHFVVATVIRGGVFGETS
ncbi:type I-F CRISPR-associated protein Csy3 [Piscinibacter sakaiensis]|uniref:CRISPR-associated protein, Csy3 family n=1 Tax=Piscinibacter sakaiensis TaxID=1547922 RepID=A0A0K8P5F4_PISS1|nr:type I-F CRISPR-associated protein Csy3 [Piscinibacter sakaiensis]GAP37739.1 CRISPR-associated protein, Csy3 family [Piscinibacter sakaiensis]